MASESGKYNKVLNILKRSKPELKGIETIQENVISRIKRTGSRQRSFSDLIEGLFAWIYIEWVRRSLVTASVLLILFFVYQQTMILKGVNNISKRAIVSETGAFSVSEDEIGKQLMMLKLANRRISIGHLEISGRQLEQLLDSYNELTEKYSDLIKIIEEDPVLKEYIEKKLDEGRNKKSNL
jgi:hypothetical protein